MLKQIAVVEDTEETSCIVCNGRELAERIKGGEKIRFFSLRIGRSLTALCEHHLNELIHDAQEAYLGIVKE